MELKLLLIVERNDLMNSIFYNRGWRKERIEKIDKILDELEAWEELRDTSRPEDTLEVTVVHQDPTCLPVAYLYEKGYYLVSQMYEDGKFKAVFKNYR